ncbi:MAG TPA: hypothetical protein ENF41_03140 [Candidatus Bathyarchaeota archaeon]|nr:hypothetical protein [Candidatus Bathyarchaeota archaeon]
MSKSEAWEVRAYKQCLHCIHREVCKFMPIFKELQNSIEYQVVVDHRRANFKLLELFKADIPDEMLDIPYLFGSVRCPKYAGDRNHR